MFGAGRKGSTNSLSNCLGLTGTNKCTGFGSSSSFLVRPGEPAVVFKNVQNNAMPMSSSTNNGRVITGLGELGVSGVGWSLSGRNWEQQRGRGLGVPSSIRELGNVCLFSPVNNQLGGHKITQQSNGESRSQPWCGGVVGGVCVGNCGKVKPGQPRQSNRGKGVGCVW